MLLTRAIASYIHKSLNTEHKIFWNFKNCKIRKTKFSMQTCIFLKCIWHLCSSKIYPKKYKHRVIFLPFIHELCTQSFKIKSLNVMAELICFFQTLKLYFSNSFCQTMNKNTAWPLLPSLPYIPLYPDVHFSGFPENEHKHPLASSLPPLPYIPAASHRS